MIGKYLLFEKVDAVSPQVEIHACIAFEFPSGTEWVLISLWLIDDVVSWFIIFDSDWSCESIKMYVGDRMLMVVEIENFCAILADESYVCGGEDEIFIPVVSATKKYYWGCEDEDDERNISLKSVSLKRNVFPTNFWKRHLSRQVIVLFMSHSNFHGDAVTQMILQRCIQFCLSSYVQNLKNIEHSTWCYCDVGKMVGTRFQLVLFFVELRAFFHMR